MCDNFSFQLSLHRIGSEPKKMVSRHTSPTYVNGSRDADPNRFGIPRNSSPILDPHKTSDVTAKGSPVAVVADGELVVFGDSEDWKGQYIARIKIVLGAPSGVWGLVSCQTLPGTQSLYVRTTLDRK